MKSVLFTSVKALILFTVLTGFVYTFSVTAVSNTIFPYQSSGSMILKEGKVVGSKLIGQKFTSAKYFHSRPSSIDYSPLPSGPSNLGPTSAELKKNIYERRSDFILQNNMDIKCDVPIEMCTASGSGLDPHISKSSALLQVNRICEARKFTSTQKRELEKMIENKAISFIFDSPVVNVLELNLKLDEIK